MEKLDLEGGGPRNANRPEPVEGVVLGDGGGDAAIKNRHHCLPDHLHEAHAAVVPSHFRDHDHCLPGRLLHKDSFLECQMH